MLPFSESDLVKIAARMLEEKESKDLIDSFLGDFVESEKAEKIVNAAELQISTGGKNVH